MQRCWLVQIAERVPRRVEIALLAPSAPDPALCPRVSAPCPGARLTRALIMNWMVVDGEDTLHYLDGFLIMLLLHANKLVLIAQPFFAWSPSSRLMNRHSVCAYAGLGTSIHGA